MPEGTVTVLFTDLVESTQLNQSLGDDAARQIGRQVEELARQAVASNRGALIKEMGDGLMAAFSSARRRDSRQHARSRCRCASSTATVSTRRSRCASASTPAR